MYIWKPDPESCTQRDTRRVLDVGEIQRRSGAVMHQPDLDPTMQLTREVLFQDSRVIDVDLTELRVTAALGVQPAAVGLIRDTEKDRIAQLLTL